MPKRLLHWKNLVQPGLLEMERFARPQAQLGVIDQIWIEVDEKIERHGHKRDEPAGLFQHE